MPELPTAKRRALRVCVLAWLAAALCVSVAAAVDDAAFQREHEHATRMILCDCGCSPQSVHDCACGRAAELRDAMAAEIRSGKSGREVVDGYVARHGEKIRIAPSATGFNLVAWLGPGIALFAGLTVTALMLRRWRRSAASAAAPATPLVAADDPYVARLEREIRESR